MKAKYVVIEVGFLEHAIVFDNILPHALFTSVATAYHGKIVSAGFCRLTRTVSENLSAQCWGESVSLKLKSRLRDDEIVIERSLERS